MTTGIMPKIMLAQSIKAYSHCMRFRLVHFQERFQIDAFSMETLNAFGWTESLKASKCIHISEIVVTG